jgi:hypothetical protein
MVALPQISLDRFVIEASTGAAVLMDKEEAHSILLLAEVKAHLRSHGFTFVYTNHLFVAHAHRIFTLVMVTPNEPKACFDPSCAGLCLRLDLKLRSLIILAIEIGHQAVMVVWGCHSIQGIPVEFHHSVSHERANHTWTG